MILNDEDIRKYCTSPIWCEALGGPMIDPFTEAVSGGGVIGYGLSSHGYDIRLAGEVYCLKSSFGEVIDPKLFRDPAYKDRVMDRREYRPGERVIIPANGYILGTSVERFNMPATVCARVLGKSTLARVGVMVNVTPLECGWRGQLTIEISNAGPAPVAVYAYEGIAQVLFEALSSRPSKTYADKNNGVAGKYQDQQGVVLARVL